MKTMRIKMILSKRCFFVACIFCLFVYADTYTVFSGETIYRAKIGIQISSQNCQFMAKSRDDLRAGDSLRVFIHPEEISFIYIVYSDKKTVRLLSMVKQEKNSSCFIFPSVEGYYEVDRESHTKVFTIVVSHNELKQVSNLLNSICSYEKWAEIEKDLIGQSKLNLSERSDTPLAVAGNVKGGINLEKNDQIITELPIYSGKSFLVKKYEFWIK